MTIKLVVNADDFGLRDDVSRGILRAHREGIVTSTSLLGNCEDLPGAKALLDGEPRLGVGLHVALVGGRPVSAPSLVSSLCDDDGRFFSSARAVLARWARGHLREDEIEREIDAQVARARDAGLRFDHLDAHRHVGFLPPVARAIENVARRHDISGIRATAEEPTVDWIADPRRGLEAAAVGVLAYVARRQMGMRRHGPRTWGFVESGRLDEVRILEILGRLTPGAHELVCHPSEVDEAGPYDRREPQHGRVELDALTARRVREAVVRRGVTLCRWSDLF